MAKPTESKDQLTPNLEDFKYEVAQEIGIANRKHKGSSNTPKA